MQHPISRACRGDPPSGCCGRSGSATGAHLPARLGARQPDRRPCLGKPTQRVGKHRRIASTPYTSGGTCHSRIMFSACLLMRTRRGVSLVQATPAEPKTHHLLHAHAQYPKLTHGLTPAHAVATRQAHLLIQFLGGNAPAVHADREGSSGGAFLRPWPDYPAATAADFSTAVVTYFR